MFCFSDVQPAVNGGHSSAVVPVTLTPAEKKKLQWAQERGQNYTMYDVACGGSNVSMCLCCYTFIQLRGQIRARKWCCEVVGGCKVRFFISSQLDPRR